MQTTLAKKCSYVWVQHFCWRDILSPVAETRITMCGLGFRFSVHLLTYTCQFISLRWQGYIGSYSRASPEIQICWMIWPMQLSLYHWFDRAILVIFLSYVGGPVNIHGQCNKLRLSLHLRTDACQLISLTWHGYVGSYSKPGHEIHILDECIYE